MNAENSVSTDRNCIPRPSFGAFQICSLRDPNSAIVEFQGNTAKANHDEFFCSEKVEL